jgi:DNA-binding NtrC family response regulator
MGSPDAILVIGNDAELLALRCKVLRWAGLPAQLVEAYAAIRDTLLQGDVRVAVLCRTLRDDQLEDLLDQIDQSAPRIKTVLLSRAGIRGNQRAIQTADIVLEMGAGPDKLIEAVRGLMELPHRASQG